MKLDCRLTHGLENIADALAVRIEVFTGEQGFTDGADTVDERAWHAVLYDGGVPVAVGRAFAGEDGAYWLGRIAVRRSYRGSGAGRQVMEALEEQLRRLGVTSAHLCAQDRAERFYEKLGYTAYGEWILEENYPHRKMEKRLPPQEEGK